MFNLKRKIMKKSIQLMFHLLFWTFTSLLVILGFQLMSIIAAILGGGGGPDFQEQFLALLLTLPIGAIIFYSSYFSLNYFAKKTKRFFLIAICYVILIPVALQISIWVSDYIDSLLIFMIFLLVLYFNVFGFLFKTFIEWIKDRKIKAELEKDKVTSQLELLKSQINPHFLFNTLNNIDVLILDEPKRASDYLKKLSEILRFMLYETNTERVPLASEVEYIKKYIELQKIRTSNGKFVELEIVGDASIGFIAPMIFIHFVENAFKFATNKKIENAISIRLDISDNKVSFMCKNHINSRDVTIQYNNGLGFNLIKQRLDLIYGMDYNLNVNNEDNWYIVNLEILLEND